MDIDAAIARFQTLTGNARYGYWKWYNEDDAHELCDKNVRRPTNTDAAQSGMGN